MDVNLGDSVCKEGTMAALDKAAGDLYLVACHFAHFPCARCFWEEQADADCDCTEDEAFI